MLNDIEKRSSNDIVPPSCAIIVTVNVLYENPPAEYKFDIAVTS